MCNTCTTESQAIIDADPTPLVQPYKDKYPDHSQYFDRYDSQFFHLQAQAISGVPFHIIKDQWNGTIQSMEKTAKQIEQAMKEAEEGPQEEESENSAQPGVYVAEDGTIRRPRVRRAPRLRPNKASDFLSLEELLRAKAREKEEAVMQQRQEVSDDDRISAMLEHLTVSEDQVPADPNHEDLDDNF